MQNRTNFKAWLKCSLFLAILIAFAKADGKIIYVDANATGANNGSSWLNAYVSLQDALSDANSADKPVEIRVAKGIYKPDQGDGITPGDREATFRLINGVDLRGGFAGFSQPDPNVRNVDKYETVLSGDLAENDIQVVDPTYLFNEPTRSENSYHVVKAGVTNETAILDGFTITGGYADNVSNHDDLGGGMYIGMLSKPTLTNCTFKGNYAHKGGGMSSAGDPTLTDCLFLRNATGGSGGGLLSWEGTPTLAKCTFAGNSALWGGAGFSNRGVSAILINCIFNRNSSKGGSGGGMYSHETIFKMTNCAFNNNSAKQGAGLCATHCGDEWPEIPTLNKCTFVANSATRYGGGMFNSLNMPRLTNCTFTSNSADQAGGGMYNEDFNRPTLTNCLFSRNSALSGSGMYNSASILMLTTCTFSGNSADCGNAIACDSYNQWHPSNVQLTNCILWDGGNEIWNNDGSTILIAYSDVQDGLMGIYDPCEAIDWGLGNIDSDPCFVKTGYWDANGTPGDANDDFWINGDYHLKSQAGRWDPNTESWVLDEVTSLCIDAGNPGCPLGDEPNDVNNIRINMGTYGGTAEASKSPTNWRNIADLSNDWLVDFNDLKVFVDYWLETGRCIPSDFSRNQSVDFIDLAIFCQQWIVSSKNSILIKR